MKDLYPHVVPLSYFKLPPGVADGAGFDSFGIVRPLGNGVASLLVRATGDLIKNVHRDELKREGIDPGDAERVALENLSALVKDGSSFRRQLTKTQSGYHFIAWTGDRFAASCMLWPGLYDWARKHLETDQIVLSVPLPQLLFIASRGDQAFRAAMKQYVEKVAEGMDKQISTEWFTLAGDGVRPYHD